MLVSTILKTELQKVFDQDSPLFSAHPDSIIDAADKWSTAFDNYAKAITPPSTTSVVAKAAFKAAFLLITPANGATQFPLCFKIYTTALAIGMLPAFTGVPQVVTPVFAPVFALGMSGAKSSNCITLMVNIIDLWMKTGMAINTATLVTVPWS